MKFNDLDVVALFSLFIPLCLALTEKKNVAEQCTERTTIPPGGYRTPCGELIKRCDKKTRRFPLVTDCSRFVECYKNQTRECPCSAGTFFVTEKDTCITTRDEYGCTCPRIEPVVPSSAAPPTTEATVTYNAVTPTDAGETKGGLSITAWYIIGSAAGGVVIIILVVTVVVLCCRMRRARLDKNIAIVENPEYTKRSSGIYSEIEDPVPDSSVPTQNRFSTFQPTIVQPPSGGATSNTPLAAQPEIEDSAHEYQQLLDTRPKNVERTESEEAAYMVTPLVGHSIQTANETGRSDLNNIPLQTIPAEVAEGGEEKAESPSKHEYFILEAP